MAPPPQFTAAELEDLAPYFPEPTRKNLHLVKLPIKILAQDASTNQEKITALRKEAAYRALDLASFFYGLEHQNSAMRKSFRNGALEDYNTNENKKEFTSTLRKVSEEAKVSSAKLEEFAKKIMPLEGFLYHLAARRQQHAANVAQEPVRSRETET
ncbi:MAG: hypothetical protein Q9168_005065 [Polycauliona sp. 1 TL-2023]